MTELPRGLYEVLVTERLRQQLEGLDGKRTATSDLRAVEAADRIALHLSREIERALNGVEEKERVAVGVRIRHRHQVVDAEDPRRTCPTALMPWTLVAAAIVEFLLAADRGYDFSSSGPSASTNSAPRNHSGVPGARCP